MLEEMLVGAYLAEVDRAVARAVRLPEAGSAGANPTYGRLHQPIPFSDRQPVFDSDVAGSSQAA